MTIQPPSSTRPYALLLGLTLLLAAGAAGASLLMWDKADTFAEAIIPTVAVEIEQARLDGGSAAPPLTAPSPFATCQGTGSVHNYTPPATVIAEHHPLSGSDGVVRAMVRRDGCSVMVEARFKWKASFHLSLLGELHPHFLTFAVTDYNATVIGRPTASIEAPAVTTGNNVTDGIDEARRMVELARMHALEAQSAQAIDARRLVEAARARALAASPGR